MAVFGRRRQPAKRYVEPPELRAGVVVLTDGQAWRVVGLNAGNGSVPVVPAATALTGEHLAEALPRELVPGPRRDGRRDHAHRVDQDG